jgi:hypothetical protein
MRSYFAELIRVREGIESTHELERSADDAVIWMSRGCAYGITKRISSSVGLEDLELTFAAVRDLLGSDWPSVSLTDLSIKLDHFKRTPENDLNALQKTLKDNAFASGILRQLVADYLYLHCSDTRTLQRLASRFNIKIGPEYLTGKSVKMLKEHVPSD